MDNFIYPAFDFQSRQFHNPSRVHCAVHTHVSVAPLKPGGPVVL